MAQVIDTSVSPLTALARRWKLAALLIVVGAGAGAGTAYLTPTTYTGEARIAVGSQSLDARVVAGYTDASQQLASDVSRYVNDRQAQNDLTPVLGEQAESVERISASPIAGSSVIMVEVDALTEAAATQGAQTIAQQLVDQVNATYTNPDELLQRYTDISSQVQTTQQAVIAADAAVAAAQARRGAPAADVQAAQALAQQQATQLDVLKVQQEALAAQYRNATASTSAVGGLSIVRAAQVSRTDFSSTVQRNGLAGAGVGGLLALLLATALERRKQRTGRAGTTGGTDAVHLDDEEARRTAAPVGSSPHRV
ncbi:hypothetical protein GTQ99_10130 [Kineococcus sp. T13]|uniref:hypothetical protein n=1 Tax=Kineococcus vitellinus TaxID=2696565 RepID=UPI001411D6FC|nr:hypothetical protein [Kineococcus vitellinus]NAZ75768.1 hypothetical protein [Kineococcus vitellinus]